MNTVLTNEQRFQNSRSRSASPHAARKASLRQEVSDWFYPYHTLMTRAAAECLGAGAARRGRDDLQPAHRARYRASPTHVIAETSSARTPRSAILPYGTLRFRTRRSGRVLPITATTSSVCSRNLGEVYGVFAVYRPKKDRWHLLGVDYLNENSANFHGLNALEGLVKKSARRNGHL